MEKHRRPVAVCIKALRDGPQCLWNINVFKTSAGTAYTPIGLVDRI